MKLTFKDIEDRGLLLYKYIRGSQAYGTNTPESDQDEGGIFIAPQEWVDGLGFDYAEEISDEKHDTVWWELGKFMRLLCTSNPTVLEALFVPDDKVLFEHPIMTEIKKHKDMFVTKASFKPFGGYATSQIAKAQGQNKKIHWDIKEMTRKTPLDFCYTFHKQGSQNIQNWLAERGLNQKYCGLVNIPNMKDVYGLYYDFAAHIKFENLDINQRIKLIYNDIVDSNDTDKIMLRVDNKEFFGYSGIIHPDGKSNEIRLSSIPKGEKQICFISYNQDGYASHCRKYREYIEWKENRNKARYENNLKGLENDKEKFYDCYLEEETEFLTNNGWKKFDEISDSDLLGCFDEKHKLQFKPALNRFDDLYSGEIYTYDSPYVRFSVTPNHKLYISDCHRSSKNNFSTKYNESESNWRLESLESIFNSKRSYYHQIQCLSNNKADNPDFDDDFIKILGMFLSEGSYLRDKKTKKPNGIRIAQTNERPGCEIMESIKKYKVKRYVYSYESRNKGNEYAYDCTDSFVLEKILECGNCNALGKRIPNYVYSFSKRQFDIFLNAMICGDGTCHKQKGHRVYYTFSEKMAKDLHTLLTLNGYNSQIYEYNYDSKTRFKRKDGIMNPTYQVFISKFNKQYHVFNTKKHFEKCMVDNARIVCFETEYGTLITRNKNKIAFHGNCKNMMHCFRLLSMCIEVAEGKGILIDRTHIDRDFLMDVRNRKYTYDELMEKLLELKAKMDDAIEKSAIRDSIDVEFVNNLLLECRRYFREIQLSK